MTLSDLILLLTFLAIVWYSWETRKLRLSSQLTNELEQKPILDLTYEFSNGINYLSLRNNGKGVAQNIQIDPVRVGNSEFNYKFYLSGPSVVIFPDAQKQLRIKEEIIHKDGSAENSNRDENQALNNFINFVCANQDKSFGCLDVVIRYQYPMGNIERVFSLNPHEPNDFKLSFKKESIGK